MMDKIEKIHEKNQMQKVISVCIIGKPNAGKSTLLNHIIGQKISIVTPKVQTTRSIITGIVSVDNTQIILFDTPGIFSPKKTLERAMVRCAWSSLNNADAVVLIIDSSRKLCDSVKDIVTRLAEVNKPIIFLLNKVDLKHKFSEEDKEFLLTQVKDAIIFPVSALTGFGVDNFTHFLKMNAYKSDWLYAKDDITNLPIRFLASEITREQLFLNLHEELPYNLTVENEQWEELNNGSIKINQVIIVARESHKKMILGKSGEMIKKIGINARRDIEELTGCKVHLILFVKVRKDWENNPEFYHYMGLKFTNSKNN